MLFHITQTHDPDSCPIDDGGSTTLYDGKVDGLTVKAVYGAFSEHTLYYVVDADSIEAVNRFLMPGFKRCECQITPVSEESIVHSG
jgi:hypothetical protein